MVAGSGLLTRRALLARGAAGAGLVLAGCGGGVDAGVALRRARAGDVRRLTVALRAEERSAAAYRGLASGPAGEAARLAGRIAAAEGRHAEALRRAIRALGGSPGRAGAVAGPPLAGLGGARRLERETSDAYVELLRRLRDPATRTLIAYVLAEEAGHLAAVRAALGEDPVAGAFL